MSKSLLSLFAVLSLWTVTAPGQDVTPEKAKTDDARPADKKSASDSEKATADDSTSAEKKAGNVRKFSVKPPLKATPTPVETPAPKRGFFSRIFGGRPKATPTPMPRATPAATPAPKIHRHRPIEKGESESSESTTSGAKAEGEKKGNEEKKVEGEKKTEAEKSGVERVETEKKGEAEKPVTEKPAEAEKKMEEQKNANGEKETAAVMKDDGKKSAGKKEDATTPVASKNHRRGKKTEPSVSTTAGSAPAVDPETAERNRFDRAKAKALEDPLVQDLKAKADSALTDEEGKKALRAYNKALFNKMRKIDDSLKDRIDIMESVILKHLEN